MIKELYESVADKQFLIETLTTYFTDGTPESVHSEIKERIASKVNDCDFVLIPTNPEEAFMRIKINQEPTLNSYPNINELIIRLKFYAQQWNNRTTSPASKQKIISNINNDYVLSALISEVLKKEEYRKYFLKNSKYSAFFNSIYDYEKQYIEPLPVWGEDIIDKIKYSFINRFADANLISQDEITNLLQDPTFSSQLSMIVAHAKASTKLSNEEDKPLLEIINKILKTNYSGFEQMSREELQTTFSAINLLAANRSVNLNAFYFQENSYLFNNRDILTQFNVNITDELIESFIALFEAGVAGGFIAKQNSTHSRDIIALPLNININQQTVMHETIHLISNSENGVGYDTGDRRFTGWNEIVTEYFTQEVCGGIKNTKLPNITTENDYNIAIILFQKTLKTIEPVLKMDFACSKSGMLHKILGDETYSNLCHISNELIYHIPSLDRVIYELNKNGMQIKDVFDFYSNRDKLPQTEDCMFFVDLISQVSDINKLIRNKYEEYISTQSTSIETSL